MLSSKQSERARNHSRFRKRGFGCLLTFFVAALGFVAGVFVGVLLVYLILLALSSAALINEYAVIGVFLGLFCLFAANPALIRLCQRFKRWRLRRHGIAVEATVAHQESTRMYNPRGPTGDQFDLTLRWQRPETGQSYEYACTYYYVFGLSRKGREQFRSDYRSGAHLPVLFSPKHPWYYVVEIPFIPTWFDVLF
jgi:hypothetical protein